MAQGLLFHPIAFPLGRMFGHRHMGSSRCAVESDGIEGEGGFRQEAGSPVPRIITLKSPNASKPLLPMPLSEKWASSLWLSCIFLPFSVSHPVSEQTWQILGLLKLRWKIQAGIEFMKWSPQVYWISIISYRYKIKDRKFFSCANDS